MPEPETGAGPDDASACDLCGRCILPEVDGGRGQVDLEVSGRRAADDWSSW